MLISSGAHVTAVSWMTLEKSPLLGVSIAFIVLTRRSILDQPGERTSIMNEMPELRKLGERLKHTTKKDYKDKCHWDKKPGDLDVRSDSCEELSKGGDPHLEHNLQEIKNLLMKEKEERKTDKHEPLICSSRCPISHALPESDSKVPGEEKQCPAHDISENLSIDNCDDEDRPVKHFRRLFSSFVKCTHLNEPWLKAVHQGLENHVDQLLVPKRIRKGYIRAERIKEENDANILFCSP